LTRREALFLVASEEIARAKDWEWQVYCSHGQFPRSALKKARIALHAAEMRANRILNDSRLPDVLEAAIRQKMKSSVSLASCAGSVVSSPVGL
jgi:hypothetical protein